MPDLVAVFGGRFSPVIIEQLPTLKQAQAAVPGGVVGRPTPSSTTAAARTTSSACRCATAWPCRSCCESRRARGLQRVGLLLTNTAWGRSNLAAAEQYAAAQTGRRASSAPPGTTGRNASSSTSTASCCEAGAQAIVLVANDDEAAVLVREMAALPAAQRVPILSHWGVTGGRFVQAGRARRCRQVDFSVIQTFSFFNAPPAAAASASWPRRAGFGVERIEDIESPVGVAHAYDMTHILAKAIDLAGTTDRAAVRDALEKVRRVRRPGARYAPPFTPQRHEALGTRAAADGALPRRRRARAGATVSVTGAVAARPAWRGASRSPPRRLAAAALLLISLASWWLINAPARSRRCASWRRASGSSTPTAVGSDLRRSPRAWPRSPAAPSSPPGWSTARAARPTSRRSSAASARSTACRCRCCSPTSRARRSPATALPRFSRAQLRWLRAELEAGRAGGRSSSGGEAGAELVALEPMRYARTASPEGALLYKIALTDLRRGRRRCARVGAGAPDATGRGAARRCRCRRSSSRCGSACAVATAPRRRSPELLAPQYLHIVADRVRSCSAAGRAGRRRLAQLLTRDLRAARGFLEPAGRQRPGHGERAPDGGSAEVASLARSINAMLDRLDEQHSALLAEREKLSAAHRRAAGGRPAQGRVPGDARARTAQPAGADQHRRRAAATHAGRRPARGCAPATIIARQARHMTRDRRRPARRLARHARADHARAGAALDLADVVRMAVEQVRPLIEARGHAARLSTCRPGRAGAGRPRAAGPGAQQPAQQRRQVHARRRAHHAARASGGDGRVRHRARQRHRHRAGADAGDLRPVHAGLAHRRPRARAGWASAWRWSSTWSSCTAARSRRDSAAPGSGATFTVRLPLRRRGREATPAPRAGEPRGARRRASCGSCWSTTTSTRRTASPPLLETRRPRGADRARRRQRAGAARRRGRIDVFLLDIGLPGMDGFELARRLRAGPQARDARLIAITGYGQAADRDRVGAGRLRPPPGQAGRSGGAARGAGGGLGDGLSRGTASAPAHR